MPAWGYTSMILPARSSTLPTSLPVVQHMWSKSYKPPCSQNNPQVWARNIRTSPLVSSHEREHHNMNLPTHIITCSPPALNLPAHDTVKHLLVPVHIATH